MAYIIWKWALSKILSQILHKVLFYQSKILRTYGHKMAKMLYLICYLNLLLSSECNGFLGRFTLHYEQDYVLFGPSQSSITFRFSVFNSEYTKPIRAFNMKSWNEPDDGLNFLLVLLIDVLPVLRPEQHHRIREGRVLQARPAGVRKKNIFVKSRQTVQEGTAIIVVFFL